MNIVTNKRKRIKVQRLLQCSTEWKTGVGLHTHWQRMKSRIVSFMQIPHERNNKQFEQRPKEAQTNTHRLGMTLPFDIIKTKSFDSTTRNSVFISFCLFSTFSALASDTSTFSRFILVVVVCSLQASIPSMVASFCEYKITKLFYCWMVCIHKTKSEHIQMACVKIYRHRCQFQWNPTYTIQINVNNMITQPLRCFGIHINILNALRSIDGLTSWVYVLFFIRSFCILFQKQLLLHYGRRKKPGHSKNSAAAFEWKFYRSTVNIVSRPHT